jgi:hypothetical protein
MFPIRSLIGPCSDFGRGACHRAKVQSFKRLSAKGIVKAGKFPVLFPDSREFGQRIVRTRLNPPPPSPELSLQVSLSGEKSRFWR